MERYIQTVLEQIRCKKAHELIRQEMEVHLEEQICDYMAEGMTREEATEAAVKDMGDPVEMGVELDRIHRPRMEWRILLFVIGISIVGLFMRYFIARECEIMGTYSWSHNLEVTILGVLLMSLFYKIDYTWIGLYAKKIGTVFCVLYLLILLQARSINGVRAYVNLGVISFSTIVLLYLFVPIYGGILFQYRGSGKAGLLKAIIWLAIPVVLALGVPNIGLAMAMGVILSLLLSVAVWKGWFRVSKKRFLSMSWCMLLGLPFLLCCKSTEKSTGADDGIRLWFCFSDVDFFCCCRKFRSNCVDIWGHTVFVGKRKHDFDRVYFYRNCIEHLPV